MNAILNFSLLLKHIALIYTAKCSNLPITHVLDVIMRSYTNWQYKKDKIKINTSQDACRDLEGLFIILGVDT